MREALMSDDGNDIDWARLGRYVAGESTPSEVADVDAWLAADPGRRELMATLAIAWKTAGGARGHQGADVEQAWRKMSAGIDALDAPVPLRTRWTAAPALRVAAVLLVSAGVVAIWQSKRSTTPTAPVARESSTFATAPGQRDSITLSDGTTILLGVSSRLTVAGDFGATSRDVALQGEALFRVRHDEGKPFRVAIAGRRVEDLGTEFNVRAYASSDTVRVFVLSGSVALHQADAAQSAVVVKPGQLGLLPVSGPATVVATANVESLTGWSRGRLVFDHTPMPRVAAELERWYGVTVVLDGSSLATRDVTVTFTGEKLADVAKVIALSVNAAVDVTADTVRFHANDPPR
jgi:transmembrane sensor